MKKLQENSIDTIITDPPYGLSFMGKKWDYDVPSVEVWKECLRVLKPGGTALIFAGSRTQHRMAVNVEDAGFILKDCIMWLYGSGFPKATDISKQLDKGHERKVVGVRKSDGGRSGGTSSVGQHLINYGKEIPITAPATDQAKLWNGWKSHGLKPAYEPVLWVQKPLTSSSDYDTIIVELNNYIELLLWQSLAKLEKMDMSSLQEMASILLSIASSWNSILGVNFPKENKFIILTETGLITELRTLKYLILENTQVKDIVERSEALGFSLSALIVERSLKEEKKNTKDILNVIVQENAISEIKENTIFAEIVKNNLLLPILSNLNTVLLNVIGKLEEIPSPNHEPILVAMKPNDGNYANNALKWGVSGLNIDGGRIGSEKVQTSQGDGFGIKGIYGKGINNNKGDIRTGRFPANIILECICDYDDCPSNIVHDLGECEDDYHKNTKEHTNPNCPCYILDEQSGELKSGIAVRRNKGVSGAGWKSVAYPDTKKDVGFNDKGGASRFFYCAKASKAERNRGCEGLEDVDKHGHYAQDEWSRKNMGNTPDEQRKPVKNNHPTVKPIKLMEYLCTLTKTPPGGIVLDPFMGSGTTGLACQNTGREFIGIEREEEYVKIAEARLKANEKLI